MKLLVTTRSGDEISEITKYTHPIIKNYAEMCGADFSLITKDSECMIREGKHHYKIMELYNLLDEYDRILCIDSDVLIQNNCPNLFDIVPYDCIGSVYEDKGSRREDRHNRIKSVQKKFGDIGWKEGYIDTGVILVSKPHREIFKKINGEFWTDRGFDDVHLGYQINKNKFCVHELSYKFHHMTMFSEGWNGSPNRFDSYIIHYAGAGIFDFGMENKEKQIKHDYQVLFER